MKAFFNSVVLFVGAVVIFNLVHFHLFIQGFFYAVILFRFFLRNGAGQRCCPIITVIVEYLVIVGELDIMRIIFNCTIMQTNRVSISANISRVFYMSVKVS